MCTSVFVISLILFGSAIGADENQAKIRFFYKSMDNYTEFGIDEAEKIITSSASWYDPTKQTVMFCHGFTGHPKGSAVTRVVSAYLALDQHNVALVNWDKLAAVALPGIVNSFTNWAMPNALQLGADLAESLLRLSAAGLDLSNTHFVGHSLGAHIFGIAGNKMTEKGVKLACITALDPSIGFDMKPAFLRLRPTSARFVSVIHSDPNKFGSNKELGVVDFWINFRVGPVLQPGCLKRTARFTEEDFCSHNRAWEYFVEAIKNRGSMLGSHANHFRMWNKYSYHQRRAMVLEIGVCDENAIPGNYYLKTAAEEPYGLGEKGL